MKKEYETPAFFRVEWEEDPVRTSPSNEADDGDGFQGDFFA